jgi:hypothetical protein
MAILFGLVCFAILFPLGLMIGAVILRAAVSISNTVVGSQSSRSYDYDDDDDEDYDEDDDDDDDDDDRPRRRRRRKKRRSKSSGAIPEPGLGKGMLIVLCAWIVNVGISLVMTFALAGGGAIAGGGNGAANGVRLIAQLVSIPVSFLVLAGMCTAMLPTSFGRACLVALFYTLICIAIAVVIFGVLFAVGFGLAGR